MNKRKIYRSVLAFLLGGFIVFFLISGGEQANHQTPSATQAGNTLLANVVLGQLSEHPEASKAGYDRKQFSDGWAKVDTCTIRDKILARDMTNIRFRAPGDCTVLSGTLSDPYTGKDIHFIRGPSTSSTVQIDHVVAVSDAWQTGAQQLTKTQREELYNDPLELIAVDGPSNEEKGDGDASEWLPPNVKYDCPYVARQIAVKKKYHLWITFKEDAAMKKVLQTCPNQMLPAVKD